MMRNRMFNQKYLFATQLVVVVVLFFLAGNCASFRCLKRHDKVSVFGTQEKQRGIGIQVTNRSTHQVMSRIFLMFLTEVLGYNDVQIIPIHYQNETDPDNALQTLEYIISYNNLQNVNMINLEVWMTFRLFKSPLEYIDNAGASITAGRFSWFVPSTQVPAGSKYCSLDYKIFRELNNTHYELYVMEDRVMKFLKSRRVEEYLNPKCVNQKCATLLAEFRNDSYFIEDELRESYLNVIWLGSSFLDTIRKLDKIYRNDYPNGRKRFIVLHWTPSELIDADIKFIQMTLPRCEDSINLQRTNCRYELTPILKYYAKSLAKDKKLMHALNSFFISNDTLEFLQRELSTQRTMGNDSEFIYNKVACKWMLEHESTYKTWILPKKSGNSKETLYIGGIFPINITDRGYLNIIGAARRAERAINQNSTILPDYQLKVIINDGQCKSDIVMNALIFYYTTQNMLGVLGPACSETVEPVAGISKHLNMMIMSYSADGGSFVDRKSYPYFFRTIGSKSDYVGLYVSIMQALGWNRVSMLTEDNQQSTQYISEMESRLKLHNFTLAFSRKFLSNVTAVYMREHLSKLKEAQSRIIIAELQLDNAAIAICEAIKLKITREEGFVWFFPAWLPKDFGLWQQRANNRCSAQEIRRAMEGHISVQHTPFGRPSNRMQEENETIKSWLGSYQEEYPDFSSYVGFVYDAVWTYALAAHTLLTNDSYPLNSLRTKRTANRYAELIRETRFEGLSGSVRFDEGGTRITDLDILQWRNNSFVKVGAFKPNSGNASAASGYLVFNALDVFNGNIPEDGRYDCKFSGIARLFHINCDLAAMTFSILICLLVIICMSLLSFYFWRQRYDRKVRRSAEIMKMFGIDLITPSRNKLNTLDKWEIPKDNVVINRRLGEGAFGTVYGGEAKFTANNWTAVAVKTLKSGASTDNRIDFLAEAETMKKLNHKNIIKLLGVCLQNEPIYTIMEFMLYGDLKTFLLARRNMVNEKITDESDISSKRLTMYAMDVARGLAYLAEQKYVHRDIACRNCLVSSQRVVKIGDFGMARPTFESDYYCFNRKGVRKLFPVRWMPPETLSLGKFTPASDMWSFGVVLFEVITFGSYPYQDLTNHQVPDYVKNGNTLPIPSGIKPQLEGLLKTCWSFDASKRPTALEVIDYISNYPRLVTPSLDCPETAVEVPDTDIDDLELLPNEYRSLSLTQEDSLSILSNNANIKHTSNIIENGLSRQVPNSEFGSDSNGSFSPITPDGYSIMSPLLMHQVNANSNSTKK